ncbi:RNA polymerase sigma factor [Larkinella bovis]|uniref:RNA polymerase sigma factor n=1 Tax=Larkinella bovis TaxID=683041 RepID=A0ABW0I9V8_9BACT
MSEIELLQACQRHDARAQTALYERHRSRMMGLCRRYAHSRQEAEDMFQEGFIRIFQQIHTIEQPERLLNWMKRVMVNTAINWYHKHHHEQSETDYEEAWEASNTEHTDILARISTEELLILIQDLADGYRMVFNLYVIDGYSHLEISRLMGISEGTSKSQLARAKDVLKQKLKKMGIVSYGSY